MVGFKIPLNGEYTLEELEDIINKIRHARCAKCGHFRQAHQNDQNCIKCRCKKFAEPEGEESVKTVAAGQ